VAKRLPGIQFIKASYLNDHPAVIDTFAERIEQILLGDNAMNCALCKYRTQILGFETEVGLAQESHHHHVEGAGTGHTHDHHHHDHDHMIMIMIMPIRPTATITPTPTPTTRWGQGR
jgi:sirohydrochlorin cobaltochelatase